MNRRTWGVTVGTAVLGLAALGGASSAVAVYQPVLRSVYSAPALYDLGNFYARAGKPAMAVLNYERARLLAPADPDIQHNLDQVRQSVGLPALHDGWLSRHERLAAPNTLYWIGVFGLAIAGLTLLLRRASAKHRVLLSGGAAIGGLMMALGLVDAFATASTLHDHVVMAATPARAAPTTAVEPLFTVPLADSVQVQDEHQAFALIRDAQGREGWVARKDLTPVIPSTARPTDASMPPAATR